MKPSPHRILEGTSLGEASTYILDVANTSPGTFSEAMVSQSKGVFSVTKIFTNTKPSPHMIQEGTSLGYTSTDRIVEGTQNISILNRHQRLLPSCCLFSRRSFSNCNFTGSILFPWDIKTAHQQELHNCKSIAQQQTTKFSTYFSNIT
jgi:hypothetical protein